MSDAEKRAAQVRLAWCKEYQDFELRTIGASTGWGQRPMARWDGGVDSRGAHHSSVWDKIVKFCDDNGLETDTLVRAMFFRAKVAPKPNMAHGQYAMSKYQEFTGADTGLSVRDDITYEFESQKSHLAAGIARLAKYNDKPEDFAIVHLACLPDSPYTQLFRYCVLRNRGSKIADKYLAAARRIYSKHPKAYDDIWGNWLPPEVKCSDDRA
jgi:hypothetical protein